jgi:hypothetical protein
MSGTLSYVREEGDLSCFPTLPHDLGVKELLHADSPFLKSTIPRNATQKDFIRKAVAFKPNLTDYAVRVKRRDPKQRLSDATFADEVLHAEIHDLKQKLGREAGNIAQCSDPASTASRMLDDATGPRPHATTVMESEALRGSTGAKQTSFLVQQLARHTTAPIASKPTPYHHFMFGGSKSDKRRLERRINQVQATAQANVQLKKQQLVDENTTILAALAHEQQAVIRAGRAPAGSEMSRSAAAAGTAIATAGTAIAAAGTAIATAGISTEPLAGCNSVAAAASPPLQAQAAVNDQTGTSAVAVSAGLAALAVAAILVALVRNRRKRRAA